MYVLGPDTDKQINHAVYHTEIRHDGPSRARGKWKGNEGGNNKTRYFSVLYSDKTYVFDQSERAQGPIYILNRYNSRCRKTILNFNFFL